MWVGAQTLSAYRIAFNGTCKHDHEAFKARAYRFRVQGLGFRIEGESWLQLLT